MSDIHDLLAEVLDEDLRERLESAIYDYGDNKDWAGYDRGYKNGREDGEWYECHREHSY